MQEVIRAMRDFKSELDDISQARLRYPAHIKYIRKKLEYLRDEWPGKLLQIGDADDTSTTTLMLKFVNSFTLSSIDTQGNIVQLAVRPTCLLISPFIDGNIWLRIFKGDFEGPQIQECIFEQVHKLEEDEIRPEHVTYVDSILKQFIKTELAFLRIMKGDGTVSMAII